MEGHLLQRGFILEALLVAFTVDISNNNQSVDRAAYFFPKSKHAENLVLVNRCSSYLPSSSISLVILSNSLIDEKSVVIFEPS